MNCQGYLNNKDDLMLLINDSRPLMIFLSETHVTDDVELVELKVDGYGIEQCVSDNKRTGGVMALIRGDIKYKVNTVKCVSNYVWLLSVEFSVSRVKYLCTVLYHPPQNCNAQFVDFFNEYLDSVNEFSGINVIMGDFNFDISKPSFYGDKILSYIYSNGFSQVVDSPTRITNVSKTLIDYVVTNDKNLAVSVHHTPRIGDHSILSVQLGHRASNECKDLIVYRRSMKGYDADQLRNYLLDAEWTNDSGDVDVLANIFVDSICDILNVMCPKQKFVFKDKYLNKAWITPDIKQNMRVRDELYIRAVRENNEDAWREFKMMRNFIVSQIRSEKDGHFRNIIDDNKYNPREMWKQLKTLLPKKNSSDPDEIIFESAKTNDDSLIAEEFNRYFIRSIEDIISGVPKCNVGDQTLSYFHELKSTFSKFDKISMNDLKRILKDMNDVGGGVNGVSKKILCDVCGVAANRLLDVVNASLASGVFPDSWKESMVIPVPKVQGTKLFNEFRPINTVEVYEKVLELAVKEQLHKHCTENNILIANQSGFRSHHSCESVVVSICSEFVKSMDGGGFVLAVFLDLKRAFETVDRGILLRRLSSMGIGGDVLRWFQSYLHDRRQRVKYKDCVSESLRVQHGVPQGTVLGPLLFLLYINDMVKVVKMCKVELFADDTMIYFVGRDIIRMQEIVNRDLNNLFDWLCNNKLSLNTSKSGFCLFGRRGRLSGVDVNSININIDNQRIKHEVQIKYLGVILDSELNFHAHADYITRKFSKKVNFIARVGKHLSFYTKKLLYNSIAEPHLQFCATLLYSLPAYKIEQLQIIQNRAMRTILKYDRYAHIATMLRVLDMLTVRQKILFNVYVFVFKIKNKLLPSYICDRVKFFGDVHNYQTRHCNDFILLEKCNSSQMLNTVLFKGLHDFNGLPTHIKNTKKLDTFKILMRNFLKVD